MSPGSSKLCHLIRVLLALGLGASCARSDDPSPALVGVAAARAAAPKSPRGVARKASVAEQPLPVVRLPAEIQDAIDDVVRSALERRNYPGCVIAIGRRDGIAFLRAYGALALEPRRELASDDALYDVASLTKPIATATSIVLLAERGQLSLDDRASRFLPELARSAYARVTLRQLLTHTAGLPAILPISVFAGGRESALAAIARTRPRELGSKGVLYSDLGFVLLASVVERVSGAGLDAFSRQRIFLPLGMRDTVFRPLASGIDPSRIAPTERGLRGSVHDARAAALGGVTGHAGLFSSAGDLARFARMLLGDGQQLLSKRAVAELVSSATAGEDKRGLGWDVADDGRSAFGHGGFTGTSFWIDPELDLFVIVLSNRLHPTGKGAVRPTVERVRSIAIEAARSGVIAPPREARVMPGIDVLARDRFRLLAGKRVGLITNASARALDGRTTAEVLARATEVRLVALFAPEHGLEVSAEGSISDSVDPRTGLPVRSLYGGTMRPGSEALSGIDTLVFDVQDVGARFYTYMSTLREALIAASQHRLGFVVLDRPNPLGGSVVEGPSMDPGRRSFVNHHPLPVRHGLTPGEMSRLLAAELRLSITPAVVALEGWKRDAHWPQTGLPWVKPSPNLPSYSSALLYPGIALLELSNVSVGRGTDAPFTRVGAPWLDSEALARALNAYELPHVRFQAERFTPTTSTYRGRSCNGIRIQVSDPERVRPVTVGLAIAVELLRRHPEQWRPAGLDSLLARRETLEAVLRGTSPFSLERSFERELAAFVERRAPYLLY